MPENRQMIIDSLPEDKLAESNYAMRTVPLPQAAEGEVLCRTLAVSIAAGTRAGLQGSASYAGAPRTGIVMNGTAVARVAKSMDDRFAEGDLVVCSAGWQDYSLHDRQHLQRRQDAIARRAVIEQHDVPALLSPQVEVALPHPLDDVAVTDIGTHQVDAVLTHR